MSRLDEDPNVYRVGYNRALDFCIWSIERDGLRVPPFVRHKDGDGSLRALGLDAAGWHAWAEAVAEGTVRRAAFQVEASRRLDEGGKVYSDRVYALGREIEETAREADRARWSRPMRAGYFLRAAAAITALAIRAVLAGRAERRQISTTAVPFPDALALWPGNELVRARLTEMYAYYKKDRRSPRRRSWKSVDLLDYLTSSRFREFVAEVSAELGEEPLPRLVCFVNYPGPVIAPITPQVVVIGVRNWDASPDEFERVVRRAATLDEY